MKKAVALFGSLFLILSFVCLLAVPASAVKSPAGESVFQITVTTFFNGVREPGDYTMQDDGTILLTISPKGEYTFTGWMIDGDYEIVSGDLKSEKLVIRPLSDLKIEEAYNVKGSQGEIENENDSDEAPVTGDLGMLSAALLTLTGLGTVLFAKKRLAA